MTIKNPFCPPEPGFFNFSTRGEMHGMSRRRAAAQLVSFVENSFKVPQLNCGVFVAERPGLALATPSPRHTKPGT